MNYTHYQPITPRIAAPNPPRTRRRIFGVCLVLALIGGLGYGLLPSSSPVAAPKAKVSSANTTPCKTTNIDQKEVIVSIKARRLWACDSYTQRYTSSVVTGDMNQAANLTPAGTYHIYAKQTDLYLDGSDSKGTWHDHVSYWMPWLSDQYGIYGFHDATWREDSDFGRVDPYSPQASHGCVELPLATARWLYGWASVGTTVRINS